VYIEELASVVHTITGAATSIGAFVGWAPRGSITEAVLVQSFSDYQRQFGGLDSRSYLGYAVNQFFNNGGQQAYIVRLAWTDAKTAEAVGVGGALHLWASSPGDWANGLKIVVTPVAGSLFNIQVQDATTNPLETFLNLSVTSAIPVIDNDSQYITFIDPATGKSPTSIGLPSAATASLGGGHDGAVLHPKDGVNGDGNFETALNADGSGTGGVHLLDRVDIFNLLCVPGEADETTISHLEDY
jgi:hypothetical protein